MKKSSSRVAIATQSHRQQRRPREVTRREPLGPVPPHKPMTDGLSLRLGLGIVVLAAGVWSYWPTLYAMANSWQNEPDYSHGFLVAPLAIFFLWLKRKSYPGFGAIAWLLGSLLMAASAGLRLFSAAFFFDAIDGWSFLIWLAGCIAILFGSRILRWAYPSLAFMIFMVPLPFRMESLLSSPLQRIATKISCWELQLLGQPAIAEGNTILLGDHQLEVEQACSGLRLFVGILALACACLMLIRRTWWEKLLLLVSVVPIAIVTNSVRIVVTGLLYEFASSEVAKHFSHDFAGWAMIPLAAGLFWSVLWYLNNLFTEREQIELSTLLRQTEL